MRPLREGAAGARQGELRPVLSGTGTAEQAEGRSKASVGGRWTTASGGGSFGSIRTARSGHGAYPA